MIVILQCLKSRAVTFNTFFRSILIIKQTNVVKIPYLKFKICIKRIFLNSVLIDEN